MIPPLTPREIKRLTDPYLAATPDTWVDKGGFVYTSGDGASRKVACFCGRPEQAANAALAAALHNYLPRLLAAARRDAAGG